MKYLPVVKDNQTSSDLYSRILEDRVILLTGEINDSTAELVMAQLLYLDSVDTKDITIYINSPGGSITAGLAILDIMNIIQSDVSTVCIGLAASMGSFLLSMGTKGKRYITENAEVMIHQPLGGAQGQSTDIVISAKRIEKLRNKLEQKLADACSQSISKIHKDCERDKWMDAEEAVKYGIVDEIIY